jgi:acyl-coenzyme A thioesterase PaaI-like protein
VPEPPGSDLLRHHDLCFGCGQANPFGLQLELERSADGAVEGRFFVKQDHQGPAGVAHAGLLAAALEEALALAAGEPPTRLEVDLVADAAVGTFVSVSAHEDVAHRFSAVARDGEGRVLARAAGTFPGAGGGA